MSVERIKLASIRTDGGTQPRAKTDEATVDRYAAAMREGAKLPPVVAFFDGTHHWLADGFHRYAASTTEGFIDIDAEVRQGTRDDAIVYSWGANETDAHRSAALPRTNADKRRAVESALRFYADKGVRKGDEDIAAVCKVSRQTVIRIRTELVTSNKLILPTRVESRDGKTRETANTGKSRPQSAAAATLESGMSKPSAVERTVPTVALMPSANMFAPPSKESSVLPVAATADVWNENDFLLDVGAQLDAWRDEWLQHRPNTSSLIKQLRLYVTVMEKEDARNRASNG